MRGLGNQNRVVRVAGRLTSDINSSTTAGTLTITEINLVIANLGDRIINIGDTFMYWRMVSMRWVQDLQSGISSTTAPVNGMGAEQFIHGAAFIPLSNANYAAPTLAVQICDFPEYRQNGGLRRVVIGTGKAGLIGSMMTKWLTVNTTSDSDMQSAGTLTNYSITGGTNMTSAAVLRSYMEFVIEFKEPIDTALIPSLARKREKKESSHPLTPNRIHEIDSKGNVRCVLNDIARSGEEPVHVSDAIARCKGVEPVSEEGGESKEQPRGEKGSWLNVPFSAFR